VKDSSPIMCDNEEAVLNAKGERRNGEEVHAAIASR
jgi:hypothetical protein